MAIPEPIKDNDLEDVQSINLQALISKYIAPIERLRSMSAPIVLSRSTVKDVNQASQREIDNAKVDNTDAQESRAHAFYRMLGLPVVDSVTGQFYNPGFNPQRTSNASTKNATIAANIPQDIKAMHDARENDARARLAVFRKQSVDASIHALVLPTVKPFLNIDTKSIRWDQLDDQKFTLPARKRFIQDKYTLADGGEITEFKDTGTHILRPFTVDPNIEQSVMPAERLICEPFLKNKVSTCLENDTFILRPGIEAVLRTRLREYSNVDVIETVNFELNAQGEADIDEDAPNASDLRLIAEALLSENKISGSEVAAILSTDVEVINLNKLIKTIKACVELLVRSVETVSEASEVIEWTPLPDERGPEFGTDLGGLVRSKRKTSKLDQKITQLQIKRVDSSRQIEKSSKDIGDFSVTFLENPEKTFDDELNRLIECKNNAIRKASNALRDIEIITGEISGLGLIDILAIYTALWAIDLDTLLSMIDDAAFNRLLTFNPDLLGEPVRNRQAGGPRFGIFEAVKGFEAQVVSILAFADTLFEKKLGSPKNTEGGNPTTTAGTAVN